MVIAGAFTSVDGYSRNHIVRLMPDGEVDTSFDPGTGFGLLSDFALERLGGAFLRNVIQEPSGDYIVVGAFESVDGNPQTGVARLFGDANAPAPRFRGVASFSGGSEGMAMEPRIESLTVNERGNLVITVDPVEAGYQLERTVDLESWDLVANAAELTERDGVYELLNWRAESTGFFRMVPPMPEAPEETEAGEE